MTISFWTKLLAAEVIRKCQTDSMKEHCWDGVGDVRVELCYIPVWTKYIDTHHMR